MKYIKGFEKRYSVTSCGKVFSHVSNKFLRPEFVNGGYLIFTLYKENKQYKILAHRLVAETYIENPYNFEQVNHKDENKTNNCINNLEWCDRKYNINYGTGMKRASIKKQKKVRCIETGEVFDSQKEAENTLGLKKGSIANYFFGNSKTANGYTFEHLV